MAVVGMIVLLHAALDRAEAAIRHWARGGGPVVVHLDAVVPDRAAAAFRDRLADLPRVAFTPRRHRCEWGTWGIVAATLDAAAQLLATAPDATHVYLASGACLPLRPVADLARHLDAHPDVDFVESATVADVPWTQGGLHEERFTLWHPLAWRRHRWLFDLNVRVQRALGVRRRWPDGVVPHMGSQWWCLTRGTLAAILADPDRTRIDAVFFRVWIPDESYVQTMARRHARRIESRSLTVSKFDQHGRPHLFYDDHLQLLRRTDAFVARKVWPGADRLYDAFLGDQDEPDAPVGRARVERVFDMAAERRARGRRGLWMQGRFPAEGREGHQGAGPYTVLCGFAELYDGFADWLGRATGAWVHGPLFAEGRVPFAGGVPVFAGAIPALPAWRDHDPAMFLRNLLWATRGERQVLQFGPADRQDIAWQIAGDTHAQVAVIAGAWALTLAREALHTPPGDLRARAAHLQRVEAAFLDTLRSPRARADIRIWWLAEFLNAPREAMQTVLDGIAPGTRALHLPPMADLTGLGPLLKRLRDDGMHPYLMGDVPDSGLAPQPAAPEPQIPSRPPIQPPSQPTTRSQPQPQPGPQARRQPGPAARRAKAGG